MRTSLTIAVNSKGVGVLIHGPEVSAAEQREKFTPANIPRGSDELQLWNSGTGKVKRLKAVAVNPKTAKPVR